MSASGERRGSEASQARPVGRRRGDQVVAVSARSQRALDQAWAAAATDLPVLVCGPTGAGRSFLSRAIHAWSARATGPLVQLPCGAIPEALQAREIFGAAAGSQAALPDAHEGALARAAGGTLLLTELDALHPDVRTRLVSALERRAFTREGDATVHPLRARVIATAGAGTEFSPPIPHLRVDVAALADRPEDVLPLASHFLAERTEELGIPAVGFTAAARAALLAETWPGNVRELRERVRQAARLGRGNGAISAEALALGADGEEIVSFKEAKRAFETRYVEILLQRCGGNISHAARLAKKDRKDFYDVIRRTGVDPALFRTS
jgi:two-component system response regulator GlrR